jgi:hypothetical protein
MNDIEKKLEALKADFLGKLEALQKEAEKQKKQEEPKSWKPAYEQDYFTLSCDFKVCKYTNYEERFDEGVISAGNCFPAKERAEQVAEKMRLLLRLEQLHDMLCPDYVPDYEDDDEVKSHVYFDHSLDRYDISYSTRRENPCMVAFDTKKNALKAAEILNKELEESGGAHVDPYHYEINFLPEMIQPITFTSSD